MKALDALMAGLVDYAGLFPPATETMRQALESYASYFAGPDRNALGRFIVPLSHLRELEQAGSALLPGRTVAAPWRLSALVAGEVASAAREISDFNRRHSDGSDAGRAVIDVVELKAGSSDEIERQRAAVPDSFTCYFEIPLAGDVPGLIETLHRQGSRAKIRTGGVTAAVFPPAGQIIDFMIACHRLGVSFKATAGLHHPVRGPYRLTYEPASRLGTMYGFLNVFLAAVLIHAGEERETSMAMLEETDASAFAFFDDAIVWRGHRLYARQIRSARDHLAISFGSCSFREPVEELDRLARSMGVGAR
ncbi:MAG: hypothetical protein ABI408_03160 [Gemmatimonadaceae bacterium]